MRRNLFRTAFVLNLLLWFPSDLWSLSVSLFSCNTAKQNSFPRFRVPHLRYNTRGADSYTRYRRQVKYWPEIPVSGWGVNNNR